MSTKSAPGMIFYIMPMKVWVLATTQSSETTIKQKRIYYYRERLK